MTGKKVFMEVNRMDGSSESIPLGPERWYLNITAEILFSYGEIGACFSVRVFRKIV